MGPRAIIHGAAAAWMLQSGLPRPAVEVNAAPGSEPGGPFVS